MSIEPAADMRSVSNVRGCAAATSNVLNEDDLGLEAHRREIARADPVSGVASYHASMKERVDLVDGKLEIESRPGAGTTVSVWVPARLRRDSGIAPNQ